MADKLDDSNASDELVHAMLQKEVASLSRQAQLQTKTSPQTHELGTIFMSSLIQLTGMPIACWFEATRVLEIAGWVSEAKDAQKAALVAPEVLLARTCAGFKCAEAMEGDSLRGRDTQSPSLALFASQASVLLGGNQVKQEDISREQIAILERIDSAPNAATWLNIFVTRLYVVSNGALDEGLLECLKGIAIQLAVMATFNKISTAASDPPHAIAVGALALASYVLQLLPASSIKPKHLDDRDWEAALAHLPEMCRSRGGQEAVPLPQHAVPAALEFAVLQEVELLRSSSLRLLALL